MPFDIPGVTVHISLPPALTWASLGGGLLPSRGRRGFAASTTVGFSVQLVLSCPPPSFGWRSIFPFSLSSKYFTLFYTNIYDFFFLIFLSVFPINMIFSKPDLKGHERIVPRTYIEDHQT